MTAMHYIKEDGAVRCLLCPHECTLKPGQRGLCRVRENEGGVLYPLNYGRITALNIDPIEKKPLYHFYPGSTILSAGSFGCNLKCSFCQNYRIAHDAPETVFVSPEELVDRATSLKDNIGIAYTYNEPTIWYEYIFNTARLAKEKGLKNVLITNGYINAGALKQLLPFIDALNIDVKAFNNDFYKNVCHGRLSPVLDTVKAAAKCCHVEITTLVIDGLNSNIDELERLGQWIAQINKRIPLHISRYYPAYKMRRPATRPETITSAAEAAAKYLKFVYIGNMAGVDNNTYCPRCGTKLIERKGYSVRPLFDGEECGTCGEATGILFL